MNEKRQKKLGFIVDIAHAAVVIGLVYLGFRLAGLVFPFLFALVLVSLLSPLVRFLHRKIKVNKKIVSVILMALLYALAGWLIFLLVTQVVFLLKDAFAVLPGYYYDTIEPLLMRLGGWLDGFLQGLPEGVTAAVVSVQDSLLTGLQSLVANISQSGVGFVTRFVNAIPSFLVTLVFSILLSFFVSMDYDKVVGFLKTQLPERVASSLGRMKKLLKNTVFRYLKAALILMLITFAELSIGFLIVGVNNPIGAAAGIAIFDALPVFGTGGIMIPWILIELLQGNFTYAAGLAILYGIVTVVRNLIEPKVVGDQLGLHPVVSLLSIYIGFQLFGVVGMIVFPMLAQILLTLHNSGDIRLYREARAAKAAPEAPPQPPDEAPPGGDDSAPPG